MTDLTPYLGFLSASLLIAMSPGPSWVYSISTTLGHGRKAGMVGNLGNSTGILCHALATALGLAALLQVSTAAFQTLKICGALYLLYLAWCAFRGGSVQRPHADRSRTPLGQIFRKGIFVSLFNPKISLLMLALLPQFIDPAAGQANIQIFTMGAMHALVAGLVHTHVVFFSSAIASRIKPSGRVQKTMRWATGCLFLGFGLRLALAKSS